MSVCDDQQKFNDAFYKAVKNARKKDDKRMTGPLSVYITIHTIFLIWGVVLAFKSQPPENRILHITAAILVGPAYVLAYYLNMLK
jgi:hypothetical protein